MLSPPPPPPTPPLLCGHHIDQPASSHSRRPDNSPPKSLNQASISYRRPEQAEIGASKPHYRGARGRAAAAAAAAVACSAALWTTPASASAAVRRSVVVVVVDGGGGGSVHPLPHDGACVSVRRSNSVMHCQRNFAPEFNGELFKFGDKISACQSELKQFPLVITHRGIITSAVHSFLFLVFTLIMYYSFFATA